MSNDRLNEDRKRGGEDGGAKGERSLAKGGEREEGRKGFSDSEAGVSPPLTKRSRRKGSHSSGLALAPAYCST